MGSRKLPQLQWTKELSRSFWNDLAATEFLERIAFAKFAAPFLVDLVAPFLRPDDFVFDFGGGDNLYLVREFLKRGYTVSCYEPNSEVEQRNADLLSDPKYRGAVAKPVVDAYDCVTFSEVIEHLDDQDLPVILGTIRESLKADGLLVVTTPEAEDLLTASRYCPTCRRLFHPWGHVRSFTAQSLERLLEGYGFRCEAVHSVDFSDARHVVEEAKTLRSAVKQIGDILARLPPEVLDHLSPSEKSAFGESLRVMNELGEQTEQEEPNRRRYGAGGTLVVLARKT